MFVNRVLQQAGNAFVECQQNAIRNSSSLDHGGIFRSQQSFGKDGIGIMPKADEIIREFLRKILIQFESHFIRIGTRRSSCASSAA